MINDQPIKISVGIISHHHAGSIERAVNSVLSQGLGDDLELILVDDASKDGTAEIVRKLAGKHTEITAILNDTSSGPLEAGRTFFRAARGEYLAWLDADDHWNHPEKLKTQIEFLDRHADYSGCFHDALIVSEAPAVFENQEVEMRFHPWKTYSQFNCYQGDYFPWDALMRKIIPTASLVFRKADFNEFFEKFAGFDLSISWAIHLWLLKSSKFRYFNETWSTYYDRPEGYSKKFPLIDFKINNIKILEALLDDDFYRHLRKDVYKALAKEYFHLLSLPDLKDLDKEKRKAFLHAYKRYSKLSYKTEYEYFKKCAE